MSKIVIKIRAAVAKARASEPFGRWIPNNKVIAATLAPGLVVLARTLQIVDLPAGWSEVTAAAVVGYLFPEDIVVSARHVAERAGGYVEVTEKS